MTASALTRPGERERLSSKLKEIDWTLVLILTTVATGLAMDALIRRRDQRTATAMFETRISGNSKPTPPSSRSRRCRST